MKITIEYLKEINACTEGIEWFSNQRETNSLKVIKKLIKGNKLDWANWFIRQLFNKKQKVEYAIYAAEQVISIFEKKYPNDGRPRAAINAAKNYLKNPNKKNANAAANAANAAYAAYAAYVAYAAAYAAFAAANAAYAAYAYAAYAAYAAFAAANAAYADANAAYADAAYTSADDASKKMKIKILNYGLSLLK